MRILPTLVALLAATLPAAWSLDVTVMSFNIRWATPNDGNNVWANRKAIATETIAQSGADVAGLQEVIASQLADLKAALPKFAAIGVGRDDGKNGGEFNPIFYNTEKFDVEASGTFWLSETPDKPGSMSWETACPRIGTWAIFRAKSGGDRFLMLNTHLDHRSAKAREEGAKLIATRLRELAADIPVVVTGDFNSLRESPPLRTLATPGPLHHARELAKLEAVPTFNGFGAERKGSEIDHILVSPGTEVKDFKVLNTQKDGVFISDHWPIVATLQIP